MYKIIGADQQEYGPVSAAQLRQWVAEGRVNGQTSVQADGTTEWKPLAAFPEFSDLFQTAPLAPPPFSTGSYATPTPEEILARDYDIDIGSCLSRAWELVKQNFWPIVGITFLVTLIQNAIGQFISLFDKTAVQDMLLQHQFSAASIMIVFLCTVISLPVYTVLTGGLFNYYLKLIRGEPAGIADAFSGFTVSFVQLVLLGVVMTILSVIGYALCIVPGVYLSVAWIFAIPLVIDRRLGFWDGMELSRKVVNKHWFIVFALLIVAGLVSISGIFACCIGVLVTMPIGWLTLLYAYEDIFGPRPH
jgi:uncharacterized membrane protein